MGHCQKLRLVTLKPKLGRQCEFGHRANEIAMDVRLQAAGSNPARSVLEMMMTYPQAKEN